MLFTNIQTIIWGVYESFHLFVSYLFEDGQEIMLGGVAIVGVVIALMGLFKSWSPIKNMKSKLLRKIILSWASVFLTFALSVVSVFVRQFQQEHIWWICILNSVGTILIYFVYENTALRDTLGLLGRKILTGVFHKKPTTLNDIREFSKEIDKEVEDLLNSKESASLPSYKDDDLKNL